MLAATDVIIGLVDEGDRLIGITRVITDFVYRAMVFDVIVKPTHRKTGLGAKLMDQYGSVKLDPPGAPLKKGGTRTYSKSPFLRGI